MTYARRLAALFLCAVLLCGLTACTQDKSRSYTRAIALFADGEFAEAAAAFDKLGDYVDAPTYAAYSHGLVLYDQGQYAAAEPYFASVREFMYGEERYQYCLGCSLVESGRFAEAAVVFRTLGAFENAPAMEQYCIARDAEESKAYETALFAYEAALGVFDAEDRLYNLQGQLYNRAIEYREAGQYGPAITLFDLLGDYLSSAEQAVACNQDWLDSQYAQAEALAASGDLQAAYELFTALSSFRDAAARAQSIADVLGIDTSEDLLY